jgi:hypothetical protein
MYIVRAWPVAPFRCDAMTYQFSAQSGLAYVKPTIFAGRHLPLD